MNSQENRRHTQLQLVENKDVTSKEVLYLLYTLSDSIKPTITCPTIAATPNRPNENYALVNLPDANANDNSGHVSVTISQKSPLKVTVGTPIIVTYTATDAAGNARQCSVNVEAKGRQ